MIVSMTPYDIVLLDVPFTAVHDVMESATSASSSIPLHDRQPQIPPPYWPPFRWSDISEYLIFCDIVIPDGITPPIFLEALDEPLRCRRRFFFSRKMAPIFLEALDGPLRCRRRFFSQKNGPLIWGVTRKWIWIWIHPVCDPMGYPVNKGEGSSDSKRCRTTGI